MGDVVFRCALFAAGLACIGIEAWNVHDYLIKQHRVYNGLVVGGIVITLLTVFVPPAAARARRNGAHGLRCAAWFAGLVAIILVFIASIERTGTATDTSETARQQGAVSKGIAEKEQSEAEAQLKTDKALVAQNCVGTAWGPICTKAKEAQADTEKKLKEARAVLKTHGVITDDSMAKRIVAILPFLNKEHVQLFVPMLLPLALGYFGLLFEAIAVRSGSPVERKPGLWARWRARRKAPVEPKAANDDVVPPAPVVQPQPEAKPEPVAVSKARQAPRPKLVATNDGVAPIMTKLLERADAKARLSLLDAANAYGAQCRAEGRVPIPAEDFLVSAVSFAKAVGIKTRTVGGMVYMVGVRLVRDEAVTGT
jgi:hypothetical protein